MCNFLASRTGAVTLSLMRTLGSCSFSANSLREQSGSLWNVTRTTCGVWTPAKERYLAGLLEEMRDGKWSLKGVCEARRKCEPYMTLCSKGGAGSKKHRV